MMHDGDDCQSSNTEDFWGEIAPTKHSIQIYANDNVFLTALEGFVSGGLRAGDSVIIIATAAHRFALEQRLKACEIDLATASARDQYIALDARQSLASFMVDDLPDERRFRRFVGELLTRAHQHSRRARAFGEMVAILWAQGRSEATLRLEQLWNEFCEEKAFCLFCAYPKSGLTQEVSDSIAEICAAHSRVIAR